MDEVQKDFLLDLIKNDKPFPEDLKEILFPTIKEEYELVYSGKMRKEDLLSNEDGTFPLPLQIDKVFNGEKHHSYEDDWKNLIVLGDNLQFLKTIYEDKDSLIKGKVKGKVKLIYIDPPFATQDEFQSTVGAKAYNDKKKGAEFLEFLRRRLILAREILADDGSIYVHIDQKMGHYIKIILDEVFGKNNFRNEIVWSYSTLGRPKDRFAAKHDLVFVYGKTNNTFFNLEGSKVPYSDAYIASHFKDTDENGRKCRKRFDAGKWRIYYPEEGMIPNDVWEIPYENSMSKSRTGYPTQKPEELIKRIIKSSSKKGDLIMDFFGGSGTTMAVAEKLGRKWITCDLGKLSYLTMQKRLLTISESKNLEDNKKYKKESKAFITCKLGMYDLKETLSMEWQKYKGFVSQLFEFELEENFINGISFDGKKRNFPTKIFNYGKYEETKIDLTYLKNLHNSLGASAPKRIYIVSPATRVLFLTDYEEINGTKFYFLNVPYEMIRELHKTPFVKFRQPKSKSKINEIEEMKGFQFVDKPEVSCKLVYGKETVKFIIEEFESYSVQYGKNDNFSTLSSIYVDYDNNNDYFLMDDVRFWDEIESTKKENNDTKVIKEKNDIIREVVWKFKNGILGENPMFIISDIYGNDFVVSPQMEVE